MNKSVFPATMTLGRILFLPLRSRSRPREHPFLLSLHNRNYTQIHLERKQFLWNPGPIKPHRVAQSPSGLGTFFTKANCSFLGPSGSFPMSCPPCLMGHWADSWPADLCHSLPSLSWDRRNPHLSSQSSLIQMAIEGQMFGKH